MAGESALTLAPAPSYPLSLEVAGVYKCATREMLEGANPAKKIDVAGVDLTLVKPFCGNSAVTLRFGYNFGDEAQSLEWSATEKVDVHCFYLMPGYRYTYAVTENTALYGAFNAGIANTSVKYKYNDPIMLHKDHSSDWGFMGSIEIGARYKISKRTEIFAAYEYSTNHAAPRGCNEQTYNGVRVGVNCRF